MKLASRRLNYSVLLLALLLNLLASMNEIHQRGYLRMEAQTDFAVYYTAAATLRDHLAKHLYDEAGSGVDPQRRQSGVGSIFSQEASRHGMSRVDLYVYPPFLAEFLIPITFLPTREGYLVWRCIGCFMVVLSGCCLSRILTDRWLSASLLPVCAGFLCFSPLWQALHYGQVTLLLLGLMSLSVVLYTLGRKIPSASAMAIAALIKLTPLLLIIPFLIWREWRWARWFGVFVVIGLFLPGGLQASTLLVRFFGHVIPPMSAGILSRENQTVLSATQMLWCRGRNAPSLLIPEHVTWIGRLLSIGLVAAGVLASYLTRARSAPADRSGALFAFALLSICAAPVAWVDTLVFGYLLLVLVWAEMLQNPATHLQLFFVFGCSVGMGSALALKDLPGIRATVSLQYLPLVSAIALGLYVLSGVWRAPRERRDDSAKDQ